MVDLRQWLRAVNSLRRFRAFAFRTYTSRHLMFISAACETRLWAHKRESLYMISKLSVCMFLFSCIFFFFIPLSLRVRMSNECERNLDTFSFPLILPPSR